MEVRFYKNKPIYDAELSEKLVHAFALEMGPCEVDELSERLTDTTSAVPLSSAFTSTAIASRLQRVLDTSCIPPSPYTSNALDARIILFVYLNACGAHLCHND